MSEEKKSEIKEEEATLEEQQLDLMEMLEKLVPPEKIEIIDIFGNTFHKPSVLSARKQIKVVREFEKVISLLKTEDIKIENNSDIIDFLVKSGTKEDVLIGLGQCFHIAFPDVVNNSKQYAKEREIEIEEECPTIDLFSLEDIVGAIVPLFIRLAKKLVGAITSLTKM